MSPRLPSRTTLRKSSAWLLPVGIVGAILGLYRWSEPSHIIPNSIGGRSAPTVNIHLDNVPFAAFAGGHKVWSLWAGRIDLEHSPYSTATSIQSATLTDIREGILYASSPNESLLPITSSAQQQTGIYKTSSSDADAPLGPPEVKFHAKTGHYYLGASQSLPGDLSLNYTSRWQLQLQGDVLIATRDGDSVHAETLTMMELVNQKTKVVEQRLECDSGATVSRKGSTVTANRLRYSLNDHTVEFLDGVRASFKEGNIQSQRTYWSLNDDVIQVPDPSTGVLSGNQFSAGSLMLDLKKGKQIVNHGLVYLRSGEVGEPLIPLFRK